LSCCAQGEFTADLHIFAQLRSGAGLGRIEIEKYFIQMMGDTEKERIS